MRKLKEKTPIDQIKIIELNQYNLNKLSIGDSFIYTANGHYKKGMVVCKMEG